jgi:type VI secretion system protein
LLALPLLLGGCAGPMFARSVAVRRVAIAVAPGANGNSPIALDLVHVSDRPPLAGALAGLSAAEWFEKRAQFQRDWPRDLEVRSWEVVPGQVLAAERLPAPAVSHEALVFALYATPGVHRARLAEGGNLSIRLAAEEMEVTER